MWKVIRVKIEIRVTLAGVFKLLVRCLYNCQTHTDRFVQRAPPIHRGHVRTHWRLSSVINASILVNYAADRDPLWLTDERRDAVPFHPIYISNNERFQRFETGGQICDEIWRLFVRPISSLYDIIVNVYIREIRFFVRFIFARKRI